MPSRVSPSPILSDFVRAVREKLPESELEKLDQYDPQIERTTSAEDGRRARHCAHWAIETASDKDLAHPEWHKIKEAHELWKDARFGYTFAMTQSGAGRPAPIHDAEIEWVEDAVNVAKIVGESIGWEHARWDELLRELISMEPADGARPTSP